MRTPTNMKSFLEGEIVEAGKSISLLYLLIFLETIIWISRILIILL